MKQVYLLVLIVFVACSTKRPNVVVLLADDLGYYDVSSFRNAHRLNLNQPPTCQTPNIDKIAEAGIRFENFYAGAAVCSPSRAALITGRNATRVVIYNWVPQNNPMHLRDEEVTLAEVLKSEGYATGHFGKWHLGAGPNIPTPADQGFDHFLYTENNAQPSHFRPENFIRNGQALGAVPGYSCQIVVDEAMEWLNGLKDDDQPFFTNIWFHEPHTPLAAPDSMVSRHGYNEDYYGAIENMDHAVGRFLDFLAASGELENTIILFASDNGSLRRGSNGALRGQKVFNYEGGLKTPLLVRWSGHIAPGTSSDQVGNFVDILPTIIGLLGLAEMENRPFDGEDLSAVIMGKQPTTERSKPLFFYRYFHDPVAVLRTGDWVLLGYNEKLPYAERYDARELAKLKPEPGEPAWSQWGYQSDHQDYIKKQEITAFELYNLREDPGQKHDLAADHPDRVQRMKTELLQMRDEMILEGGDWY